MTVTPGEIILVVFALVILIACWVEESVGHDWPWTDD